MSTTSNTASTSFGGRPAPLPGLRAIEDASRTFNEVQGRDTAMRFTVVLRTGAQLSYPYSYVSLIEVPSPERIVIHCNCSQVERIEVLGLSLGAVAESLTSQRLSVLRESQRPEFSRDGIVVSEVQLHLKAAPE